MLHAPVLFYLSISVFSSRGDIFVRYHVAGDTMCSNQLSALSFVPNCPQLPCNCNFPREQRRTATDGRHGRSRSVERPQNCSWVASGTELRIPLLRVRRSWLCEKKPIPPLQQPAPFHQFFGLPVRWERFRWGHENGQNSDGNVKNLILSYR